MTQISVIASSTAKGPLPAEPPTRSRSFDLRTALLVLVTLILGGWTLRALAIVVVPLVAAVLIALAVIPVQTWVRDHVPRWLSWLGTAVAMTLILLVLCFFFGGLWLAAQQVLSELPARPVQIVDALQDTTSGTGQVSLAEGAAAGAAASAEEGAAERAASAGREGPGGTPDKLLPDSASWVLRMLSDRVAGAGAGVAATILNSALTTLAGLIIIFFLTLLILTEREDWRDKVATVVAPRTERRLTDSADVIAGKVRAYLALRTALGLATASLYAVWLWLFGVGLVLVWAMITFLLSFIPVVGSLVAGLLPVAYALLTQDWGTALLVGLGIFAIEQVMGSFVDPKIEGHHIALSPLVVLLALLFWGWVWGIAGALLAVPVTVSLVVLGSHVPSLRPWALLLTNRTTMRGLDEATRPT